MPDPEDYGRSSLYILMRMEAQGNVHIVAVKVVEFVEQTRVCGHEEGNLSQNNISFCKIFCRERAPASNGGFANSEEVVFELCSGRIFAREVVV